MSRIPITDEAFDRWMQTVEDRLDRLQRGQGLRGLPSFGNEIILGDVSIKAVRNTASGTTDVVLTKHGGTPIVLVTLS